MNIEISTSITKFKCFYFHFLDGYLNNNCGNSTEYSIENMNFILKNIKGVDIQIYSYLYNNNNLSFIRKQGKREDKIIFNLDKLDELNESEISELLNYTIIPIEIEKHQTSFLIYTINDLTHILLFNSGEGIENHNNKSIDDNTLYQPYIKIFEGNLIEAFKLLICLLNISFLHIFLKGLKELKFDKFKILQLRYIYQYYTDKIIKTIPIT